MHGPQSRWGYDHPFPIDLPRNGTTNPMFIFLIRMTNWGGIPPFWNFLDKTHMPYEMITIISYSMIFHDFPMVFHDFPWFSHGLPWFSMIFPRVSCLFLAQACRLRYVGDWLLPCQERFERLDEELGERLRGHPGMLGSSSAEPPELSCCGFQTWWWFYHEQEMG